MENAGLIGRSIARVEDDRLLRGLGCFLDDVQEPTGTLHLAFVMSPHAHADIVTIDTERARRAKGVAGVFVGADFADKVNLMTGDTAQPGYQIIKRPVMAVDRVRFVGEFVAVVAAKDRYLAEDAAGLIEVSYAQLPAICDIDGARRADAIKNSC